MKGFPRTSTPLHSGIKPRSFLSERVDMLRRDMRLMKTTVHPPKKNGMRPKIKRAA